LYDCSPRRVLQEGPIAVQFAVVVLAGALVSAVDPFDPAFEIHDCLRERRADLEASLDDVRAAHVRQVEERGFARTWRRLDRRLEASSTEGRRLVEAWLDDRDVARRRYLCEDGLPMAASLESAAGFLGQARTVLAAAWAVERDRLDGPDADREAAALRLEVTLRALLDRFDAMFDNREPDVVAARADLWSELEAFRAERIEPWRLGRSAVGTLVEFERDPHELLRPGPADIRDMPLLGDFVLWVEALTPQPPDMSAPEPYADMDYEPGARRPLFADQTLRLGHGAEEPSTLSQTNTLPGTDEVAAGKIPDPKDVMEAMRIQLGWRRQRRQLKQEFRQERRRLGDLEDLLARGELSDEELDRVARDAERSRRTLSRISEDVTRLMARVQAPQASRPWVEDMLRNGPKRETIDDLDTDDRSTVTEYRRAERVLEQAIERGAQEPGTGPRGGADGDGLADGVDGPGSGGAGTAPQAADASGPAVGERPAASPALTWEGPLPPPDAGWSADVVDALLVAHPDLDEVDARILLGLVRSAMGGLPRGDVEARISAALQRDGRLQLRGPEARLSELYRPDLSPSEQARVVFVLMLSGASD